MKKLLSLLILLPFFGLSCTKPALPERPNIVYIMLDEWGYYEWSGIGHPVLETPNIDLFAKEGMRFTQMLAGGCVCAPTRSALMTGQHTGHTTVRKNSGGISLREDDLTIAGALKEAGYATGGFGKWGIGDRGTSGVPEKHGFNVFYGYYHQVHAHTYYPVYLLRNSEKIYLPGNTGHPFLGETYSQYLIHENAKSFIRDNSDKGPFFAYLPYTLPHAFYGIPEDDPDYLKYKDLDWDVPQHHPGKPYAAPDEAKRYAAFVAMADRQVGEILKLLKELDIDENTIVFLSGDNGGNAKVFTNSKYRHNFFGPNHHPVTGEFYRGGKGDLYEGGLRVNYLVRWPGKVKAGTVSDHLGYFPDVFPTLAELAGTEVPENIDGLSFVPTLLGSRKTGRQQEQHEYLYWEHRDDVAVRSGKWKAVKVDGSDRFELYDLESDVSEQQDISGDYPEIVDLMEDIASVAHVTNLHGTVFDPDAGFQGHRAR